MISAWCSHCDYSLWAPNSLSIPQHAQGQFYCLEKRNLNIQYYETSLSSTGLFFTRLVKMGSKYVFTSTIVAVPKFMSVL